jgi:hypothetical protein
MANAKLPSYGIWAILALLGAAIGYSVLFNGPSNQQIKDSCYERRIRSFPTELSGVMRDQIIHDCEMELRKSKGVL